MAPPALQLAPPPVQEPEPEPAHPAMAATPTLPKQVRVSVKISARDPSLFIARPLADGQALPPGTREALLVIGDPGAGAE